MRNKAKSKFRLKCPIRKKLVLYITIPLIIIYGIVLFLSYDYGKENALQRTRDYLTELTAHNASELNNLFYSVSCEAAAIADSIKAIGDISDRELADLVCHKVDNNKNIYGMAIAYEPDQKKSETGAELYAPYFYKSGKEIESVDLADKYYYPTLDWYLIPALLKEPYWTEPYFDEGGGDELMVTCSHPVISDGRLKAVATADLSLHDLSRRMSDVHIMAGYTFIISRTGSFVYHPIEDYIMRETIFSLSQYYDLPYLREIGRDMIKGGTGVKEYLDFDTGEKKWLVYTPIKDCKWSFAAVIPEAQILSAVRKSMIYQSIIMLAGLLLIIVIIIWVSYGITRPISRLTEYAEYVAEGNLDKEIEEIKGSDEISELSHIFNKMTRDLKIHIARLMNATKEKEAADSELRIARQIQESLLPRIFPPFPEMKEFDLYAANIPAKEVAGDFYDFFFIDKKRLALIIADVSGKGISAGLYMVIARTLTKMLCQRENSTPAMVLNEANRILCQDNDSCMFITLFLGYYDIYTGELSYSNAGHKGSSILTSEGSIKELQSLGNMAMGISDTEAYRERSAILKNDDRLILFTDGVTEATSSSNELYGEERFYSVIKNSAEFSLKDITGKVCNDLLLFQGNSQFDDITLLLLKRIK